MSLLRNLACWIMFAIFPLALLAADPGSAMLHSKGGAWVNGQAVPESTAVFSGDLIETKPGSVANLDAEGSSVLIQSESVVKLGDNALILEHGSVSVGTSTEMRVQINCLTVVPVANQWTQYDVTDVNGTVQVVAHKQDVNITQQGFARRKPSATSTAQSATVHQGEQASREESVLCGPAKPPGPAGGNPISTTRWIEIGGAGGGAILLCVLLCRGSSHANVSSYQP